MLSYDQLNVMEVPISQKDGRNFDRNRKAEKDDHETDWEKNKETWRKRSGCDASTHDFATSIELLCCF